jgi:L-alanine-DL-glutamate epimerase-like enolase superfamily enzyme
LLEEYKVDLLEEPITPSDADGFAEIQSHTTIPIAGGENLFTVAEFARFIQRGVLRVVQPDVGRIGGVTGWMRVAQLADAFNLPVAGHLMQEVSVHLLCAAKNASMLEYVPVFDPIFESPLQIAADGSVAPHDIPGVGVKFRKELIEPYRL